jgi:hypothetical protein
MPVLYKILCEVKLMHEYYLTKSKGENVFDFDQQNDRIDFLLQHFIRGESTIGEDLEFVFPDKLRDLYTSYNLRFLPAFSGFKIAIRCNKVIATDGSTRFEPAVELPNDSGVAILLRKKNNIDAWSNLLQDKPFSSSLFFSNDNFPTPKIFPFLSGTVPPFDSGRTYAQGEIAAFTANDIREFLNDGSADPWLKLKGNSYINESDRFVVPLKFPYTFSTSDNVTVSEFSLEDQGGNEIKKITLGDLKIPATVWLDFRLETNKVKPVLSQTADPQLAFTLKVGGNNGYARTFKILFADDDLSNRKYSGIILLKNKVSNTQFNLTDNDGHLHARVLADQTKIPAPVFELWMKSRLVYWHYRHNQGKKIKLTPDTQDLLSDVNGVLITKIPRSLSYSPLLLKRPDNSFQYLPNPVPGELVKSENAKAFVNILVPRSKMFPLA